MVSTLRALTNIGLQIQTPTDSVADNTTCGDWFSFGTIL